MRQPHYFTITKKILIGFFILGLLTGCSSVLYYPTPVDYVTAEQMPVKPEDKYVSTPDGEKLRVWQFHTPKLKKPKAVILQFHGNGQNMTSHFTLLYPVLSYSYDFVAFDYRGYGKSTGEPTPKGLIEDSKTIIRWVKAQYPETPLIIFAQSLGGAVAMRTLIDLKNEVPIRALILDSTFASYRSAARRTLSNSWITWLFQPIAWLIIDNSTGVNGELDQLGPYKKIVVHGLADHVVSYKLGEAIFEELKEPKEFWPIENGEHIDFMWRNQGEYAKKLMAELEELVAQ
jgi:fermentation-respiration switch protein FrsA (DUF1100 family)